MHPEMKMRHCKVRAISATKTWKPLNNNFTHCNIFSKHSLARSKRGPNW
jgi:hypothetical protein